LSPTGKARFHGTNISRGADHNQRVTLHAIRVHGPISRVELAEITGLTAPAVSNITRKLQNDGLIREAGQYQGDRGPPATKYVVSDNACYSIGVNIDRDHVTVVVVDFAGAVLGRRAFELDFALPDKVQDLYRSSIPELLKEAGVKRDQLIGVGVAIPDDLGLIDLPGRPEAYSEWTSVNLKDLLAEPLHLPIFVENDAAAASMGEMQLGLGHEYSSFFYLLISLALGGGLVVDGKYFRGANGRSGELGFITARVGGADPQQVQTIVSLSGLAAHLKAHKLSLADAFGDRSHAAPVRTAVEGWLDRSAAMLLEPLVAVNCLINPAAVLIGGRLPAAIVDRLAERVNALLEREAKNVPALAPVRRAALSEDAPAVGGAIVPFSHFLLPKATEFASDAAHAGAAQAA